MSDFCPVLGRQRRMAKHTIRSEIHKNEFLGEPEKGSMVPPETGTSAHDDDNDIPSHRLNGSDMK